MNDDIEVRVTRLETAMVAVQRDVRDLETRLRAETISAFQKVDDHLVRQDEAILDVARSWPTMAIVLTSGIASFGLGIVLELLLH